MDPESNRRLEDLLPAVAAAATYAAPDDCPPDDLILGLVQQRLPEGVAEGLRAHLADCDACRETAALLADEDLIAEDRPAASHPAARPLRLPMIAFAVAAVLVLALGLRSRRAEVPPVLDTDARLVAAVQALAQADPDHFATFRVLDGEERVAAHRADVRRGALRLQTPRYTVLGARPSFRWPVVPGASAYRVSVADAEGGELWVREVPEPGLLYPDDELTLTPGAKYLWSVEADGALGPVHGLAVFEVADEESARRFEEARQRIGDAAAPDLAVLLEAHLAIRNGFLGHAWTLVGATMNETEEDPVVLETRRYLARRLEIPERE